MTALGQIESIGLGMSSAFTLIGRKRMLPVTDGEPYLHLPKHQQERTPDLLTLAPPYLLNEGQ
jgi:hypothetical protein